MNEAIDDYGKKTPAAVIVAHSSLKGEKNKWCKVEKEM